ncbi:DUF1127 domain-containing protein, partial [Acinetobacter baumannii]|uniref:DUF1127 domain-containing protein n=1 Tax=Acinetobacter baumannii TaxID=470 RepID=UPI001D17B3C8
MDRSLTRPYQATLHSRSWQQLLRLLQRWQRNYRTRQQLAQLDDRQLADVGIPSETAPAPIDFPCGCNSRWPRAILSAHNPHPLA